MIGFDGSPVYTFLRIEVAVPSVKQLPTSLRANVLSRVKTAFANAFAAPSFAPAIA